jgi:hypothetical protein
MSASIDMRASANAKSREAWLSGEPDDHAVAAQAQKKAAETADAHADPEGAKRHRAKMKEHLKAAKGADPDDDGNDSIAPGLAKAVAKDTPKDAIESGSPLHAWMKSKAAAG